MSSPISPTSRNSERGYALQKYLLLHSQHDALQKHLNQIMPSLPAPTASSSRGHYRESSSSSSFSSSPSDDGFMPSSPTAFRNHHRSGSLPRPHARRPILKTRRSSLPAVIDENTVVEIESDESKIKDVNQQIKSTLTDLLNCDSVRADARYRKWVQSRLMDTERELQGSKSRNCERRRMSQDVSAMMMG